MMKIFIHAMIMVALLSFTPYVFAEGPSPAVEVGNTVCPVSGEEIGMMGKPIQVEYEGKVYNLCCPGCIATFKKAPEKYVKIVEEGMKPHDEMDMGHGQEGHHQPMGEGDGHMMVSSDGAEETGKTVSEEMKPSAEVKEFGVEAYQFGYSPEIITVNKGDLVRIHATSRDVPHGFLIKEYGINERLEKGAVKDIEFVADKAGEFEIRCSVYCDSGHANMKAKLVVQ